MHDILPWLLLLNLLRKWTQNIHFYRICEFEIFSFVNYFSINHHPATLQECNTCISETLVRKISTESTDVRIPQICNFKTESPIFVLSQNLQKLMLFYKTFQKAPKTIFFYKEVTLWPYPQFIQYYDSFYT